MSGPEIEKCERTPWKSEASAKPEAPKCATVRDIVKKYLEDNGFGGLQDYAECACDLDDLMPHIFCDHNPVGCTPGYKSPCDCGEHDYHIGSKEGQE